MQTVGSTKSLKQTLSRDCSIEISPRRSGPAIVDIDRIPAGWEVFITHLPGKPNQAMTDAARMLAGQRCKPVPHLAARGFADEREFITLATDLADAGARAALIIGGNGAMPSGPFATAIDLVKHGILRDLGFQTLYFAGHPEGHPDVAAPVIEAALDEKMELARSCGFSTGIVTQFGFDGRRYGEWIMDCRRRRRTASIKVGLAGVASLPSLLKFAAASGVGPSIGVLKSRRLSALRLLGNIDPEEVIGQLAATLGAIEDPGDLRLHFFPFGGIRSTLEWLDDYSARMRR